MAVSLSQTVLTAQPCLTGGTWLESKMPSAASSVAAFSKKAAGGVEDACLPKLARFEQAFRGGKARLSPCLFWDDQASLHRHSQIPASGDLAQASRCSSRSLRTSKTFSEAGRPRQTAETPAWHGQTLNCSWVPCRSAEWPLLACEQGLDFRLRRSGHAACPF